MTTRRHFLKFLAAAPAIVAAERLMPVKSMLWTPRTNLYVDAIYTGTDWVTLDGSPERPFATLQQAMDFIGVDLPLGVPGMTVTINIAEGTYAGVVVPPLINSHLIIKGTGPGETILLQKGDHIIDAMDTRHSLIELRDLTTARRGEHAAGAG